MSDIIGSSSRPSGWSFRFPPESERTLEPGPSVPTFFPGSIANGKTGGPKFIKKGSAGLTGP